MRLTTIPSGELRKKDAEQALLFEEKMNLQIRLLHEANIWSDSERVYKLEKEVPDYTRLAHNEGTDTAQLWQEVNLVCATLCSCFYFLHVIVEPAIHRRVVEIVSLKSIEVYISHSTCRWLWPCKKPRVSPARCRSARVALLCREA